MRQFIAQALFGHEQDVFALKRGLAVPAGKIDIIDGGAGQGQIMAHAIGLPAAG